VQLPKSFLPNFNEGTSLVTLLFTPGISLTDSERMGAQAERLISAVPEVVSVSRRTGRAELDEHAEGVHMNEIDVNLAPRAAWASAAATPCWPISAHASRRCRARYRSGSRSAIVSITCSPVFRRRSS
jgi:Cu/Ag efflux pump CusA